MREEAHCSQNRHHKNGTACSLRHDQHSQQLGTLASTVTISIQCLQAKRSGGTWWRQGLRLRQVVQTQLPPGTAQSLRNGHLNNVLACLCHSLYKPIIALNVVLNQQHALIDGKHALHNILPTQAVCFLFWLVALSMMEILELIIARRIWNIVQNTFLLLLRHKTQLVRKSSNHILHTFNTNHSNLQFIIEYWTSIPICSRSLHIVDALHTAFSSNTILGVKIAQALYRPEDPQTRHPHC